MMVAKVAGPGRESGWPVASRRLPAVAFIVSIAVHVAAYLLMPQLTSAWQGLPEMVFVATLIPERLETAKPVPPAAPKRAVRSAARTKSAPRVDPVSPPEPSLEGVGAPGIEAGTESGLAAANAITPAPENVTLVESTPIVAAEPPTPNAPQQPAPRELPTRISLSFKATSSISDGVADYTWKRDGSRYETESTLQASGFFVSLFAGVMHQVSQGEVDATGLKPDLFRFRRGEGEAEMAEFLRPANELRLTRGGRARTQPLPPNIQDTQSFLFQLAYEAPRLTGLDDRLDVLVTNARKVYRHRFKVVGTETVETRFGPVSTLHLRSEAVDPEDVYEVWLSPENYHLPVKLKFFAGRFPIELIATSIRSTP